MAQPISPSAEYLAQTCSPSKLIDPTDARKLLVLDLNGTILYRPKRQRGSTETTPDGARLRPVHPRPYISSFRQYLFHPATRQSLDVLIWSSTQPHNVRDMVDHCFPKEDQENGNILAIWARDMFGLDESQYKMKHQTVKDLEKVWAKFPNYSVASTILLDDSTRKAQMQPWNHLWIRDYGGAIRSQDVAVWRRESEAVSLSAGEGKKKKKKEKEKEKRKEKQRVKLEAERQAGEQRQTAEHAQANLNISELEIAVQCSDSVSTYDETLLAIIGVLESIKGHSNVASWFRSGGLRSCVGLNTVKGTLTAPESLVDSPNSEAWFEDAEVTRRWTEKGKRVLEAMGIPIVSGVRA